MGFQPRGVSAQHVKEDSLVSLDFAQTLLFSPSQAREVVWFTVTHTTKQMDLIKFLGLDQIFFPLQAILSLINPQVILNPLKPQKQCNGEYTTHFRMVTAEEESNMPVKLL